MAPKKKEAAVEKPVLGRFKSHLKIGIVGLPNVGKSTLFNALTKLTVPAENFPFCTIEPNTARVYVPDERFNWLTELYKPKSSVAAFLDIVDIAGLVKGAASGEGLGNNFLSHIAAVDGILHVCRAFEDPDVIHTEDRIDPVEDLDIIHSELRAKDLERLEGLFTDARQREKKKATKEVKEELETLNKIKELLESGKDVRHGDWNNKDVDFLNANPLITSKPVVYLVNLTEKAYATKKSKWLPKVFRWVSDHGGEPIIPFSGALEAKLLDMPEDGRAVYCKENELQSALPKIITTGFRAIQLIYFFTAGEDEVKCWQIRKGTKAPQAAGTIHTDFEKGFVMAEVMHFDELKEIGSEVAVKAAGKLHMSGKTYVVQDGDVIYYKVGRT